MNSKQIKCDHDYQLLVVTKPIYESRYPASPYLSTKVKTGEKQEILKICRLCDQQLNIKIK